ncbi:hypothetical protein B0O99DRAFT_478225, partial [Bisporella sp. PMI_857]
MRSTRLGAAAVMAGSLGQAFLLPPTISKGDADLIASLPVQDAAAATGEMVVDMACPGCPVNLVDVQGHVSTMKPTVESILRFNLALSSTDDADRLMLNGYQLYPVEPTADDFSSILTADQLVRVTNGWHYTGSPELGYMISVGHPNVGEGEQDIGLVAVHLEILQVSGKAVEIPTIDINLLETPSGKLMIGNAILSPPKATKPYDQCTNFICRLKAIIASKFSEVKGKCGGQPKHSDPRPNIQSAHGHMGHPRPHGHHPSHRRHGRFARFMRSLVFHVFIPIIIGVVMGITASLVGMIAGHFVLFLWRTFVRRGKKDQQVQAEDSKGLLANQSPPPVYEE